MIVCRICKVLLALPLLISGRAGAGLNPVDDAHDRGQAIHLEMKAASRGFLSLEGQVRMFLESAQGMSAERKLRIWMRERPDETIQMLCVVDWPADVRGTAVLSHQVTQGTVRQWLFLPEIGRVRRLAGGSRSGSFMGSEFTYADLSGELISGADPVYSGAEQTDGFDCHVLVYAFDRQSHPIYKTQKVWVDQVHFVVRQIAYFDRHGTIVKTLALRNYAVSEQARFRFARTLLMTNRRNGNTTLLEWLNPVFGEELPDRLFDHRFLNAAADQ